LCTISPENEPPEEETPEEKKKWYLKFQDLDILFKRRNMR
jgi:hypothetical protein